MWNFYQPVRVVFGEDEVKNLSSHLETLGYKKALLISTPFIVRSGLASELVEQCNGKIAGVFSDIEPNPSLQDVDNAVEAIRAAGADCLVAIGGGSSMDCAKAAAVAFKCGCTARDLMNGAPLSDALPIIAIPTTSGTGSEVSAASVLSDKEKGVKRAFSGPVMYPKLAIVDPVLTYTVPRGTTASTGFDVLAHAFDAMSSVHASPVSDSLALRAASLALANLERAYNEPSDKEARGAMAQASVIAGLAFSQTGTSGSHACSYILTSKYGLPHGEACAFTLDSWLAVNAEARPELSDYAKQLGFDGIDALCKKLGEMKRALGMRTTLSDAGIAESELDAVCQDAMASANMKNNVAQIGLEGVRKIYLSKK